MKKERLFFSAGEAGYKDLQVVAFTGGDTVSFSAEDEWCGCTETGFGATVSVDINRNDAEKLVEMLTKWLGT